MIIFIAKWTVLSLVLIMLIHHLYTFFQATLTIPKTRDLVNRPADRYNEMLSTITAKRSIDHSSLPNKSYVPENISVKKEDMKGELAAFLQDLKKSNTSSEVLPANSHTSL